MSSQFERGAVSTFSACLIGVDSQIIEVEADQRPGMVKMFIVGLPDKACLEAKERIKSAIRNLGERLPQGQFVFNLAPADLPKYGAGFDLAMAIALLIRRGVLSSNVVARTLLLGELALDGKLRSVHGVLAAVQVAKSSGFTNIIIPTDNAKEASLVDNVNVYSADSLRMVVDHLQGSRQLLKVPYCRIKHELAKFAVDFKHVRGHAFAKRALEIAAAGGHNILMSGPPGSGKTMLAKALVSIMPPMILEEMIEVTKIHSAAGQLSKQVPFVSLRPFRCPHHTASSASLVGGGSSPKPGEISLAHRGLLFLDELTEFPRLVLENLRQPLESGMITVSRAKQTLDFPARFLLVAAMNPCPCGFSTDPEKECRCLSSSVQRYQNKLSGPLLDRFDLFLDVPRLVWKELVSNEQVEGSIEIKNRVILARERQAERQNKTGVLINQELSSNAISKYVQLDNASMNMLEAASHSMNLSNRAYYRILKVARTIADLAGSQNVRSEHVGEALQYRRA